MKGSDFIKTLPEQGGPARERLILEAVRSGLTRPASWAEIHATYKDHKAVIRVTEDVFAIGEEDDWVRIAVSASLQWLIADELDLLCMTARLCDLVHAQAAVKVTPCFQQADNQIGHTSRMLRHHEEIEKKRAGRSGLISTLGKEWILDSTQLTHPMGTKAGSINYGWHDPHAPNGHIWQARGYKHNRWHVDYSQWFRGVAKQMVVDGEERSFLEVAKDPALYGLVLDAFEHPLRLDRHPGVSPGDLSALDP